MAARHSPTPSASAQARTAGSESPERMATARPRAFSDATTARASGRSFWRMRKTAVSAPCRKAMTEAPGCACLARDASASRSQKEGAPSRASRPSMTARTPAPAISSAAPNGVRSSASAAKRLRQRMMAGERQPRRASDGFRRSAVGGLEAELRQRQRAGLVEDDHVDAGDALDGVARAEKQP